MTVPANNPGTAPILVADEVTALHGATKAAVDAVTAKLEAMRLLIDTLETLGGAGNTSLAGILTAVQDTTAAAVTVAQLPATVGPKTAATSLSMAFATDGTQPLPTGASTAAKQDTIAAVNATIGTRAYGTPTTPLTVNTTDSVTTGLTATEVLLHASTRCFVLAGAVATSSAIPLEAGEKFHMRLTSGQQIHVIRDTANGVLNVIPVA